MAEAQPDTSNQDEIAEQVCEAPELDCKDAREVTKALIETAPGGLIVQQQDHARRGARLRGVD